MCSYVYDSSNSVSEAKSTGCITWSTTKPGECDVCRWIYTKVKNSVTGLWECQILNHSECAKTSDGCSCDTDGCKFGMVNTNSKWCGAPQAPATLFTTVAGCAVHSASGKCSLCEPEYLLADDSTCYSLLDYNVNKFARNNGDKLLLEPCTAASDSTKCKTCDAAVDAG